MPNEKAGSTAVQVYPCAYRGQTTVEGTTYLFNPESRLPTEHNITEALNAVSTVNNGSYVISKDLVVSHSGSIISGGPLVMVIHGYRFELSTLGGAGTTYQGATDIWASIKLDDKNTNPRSGNTDYKATSLVNYENVATGLDVTNNFTGLVFDTEKQTGTGIYSLHILTRASAASGVDFKVPSSSLLRLDATNIADVYEESGQSVVSDRNIHEAFTTGELGVSADTSIGGDLDVTGALGVTGATTLGNTLTMNGDIVIASGKTIRPATTIGTYDLGTSSNAFSNLHVNNIKLASNNGYDSGSVTFTTTYLKTNTIQSKTSGGSIAISSPVTSNSNITLGNAAKILPTSGSTIGTSSDKFSGVYATNFYGTLDGVIKAAENASTPDAGFFKDLTKGWYNVCADGLKFGTSNLGSACFQIYVSTDDSHTTYYSNIAMTETAQYIRIKSERTGSAHGKISIQYYNSGWQTLTDYSVAKVYITKIAG